MLSPLKFHLSSKRLRVARSFIPERRQSTSLGSDPKAQSKLQGLICLPPPTTMKLSSIFLLCASSPACAFLQPPAPQRSPNTNLYGKKLNDVDLMVIENVAELCLQTDELAAMADDCDLEEHEALVNQLQDQRDILSDQVTYIDSILAKLKGHEIDGHSISNP